LDVDDDIWQDIGPDDAYDDTEPPLWLKDDGVRDGIKAMLELDRCDEEKPRLFHDCRALRYWLAEEWEAIESVIKISKEQGKSIGWPRARNLTLTAYAQTAPRSCISSNYGEKSYASYARLGRQQSAQSLSLRRDYRSGVRARRS
jgi:hypothetical protein